MSAITIPYGTTEGQTAKIAEYIADVVRDHGHDALRVVEFVRTNRATLDRLPSALFSVSLAAHGDKEEAESYVEEFEQETGWRPSMVALFGGALL
jgi:menaquinone-dependent protoporphyrinogen oxidase